MINVLLSTYDFDNDKCFNELKDIIKPNMKVAILPFSHDLEYYKNEDLFNSLYDYEEGKDFNILHKSFHNYGIQKENIYVANIFRDSVKYMKYKINNSDIVFLTGGNVLVTMGILKDLDLVNTLKKYQGIVIGASAGAVVQMKTFITDEEGNSYGEYITEGLGLINENYQVIVHYDENDFVQRVLIRYFANFDIVIKIKDGEVFIIYN